MKKILSIALLIVLTMASSFAQNRERRSRDGQFDSQQMLDRVVNMTLSQLGEMPDSTKTQFVAMYKDYLTQYYNLQREAWTDSAVENPSEEDADILTVKGFLRERNILELKIAYYNKFRVILSATQVRKIFNPRMQWGRGGMGGFSRQGRSSMQMQDFNSGDDDNM